MMQRISRLLGQIDGGLVLAGLLSLFVAQSLFQPGLPTLADLTIHLYRALEYGQAWAPGVIVPRWAPNLAYGYGYPLFVFAPPLPYLLGLVLASAGLSLASAFKVLMILTALLYAAGMYLLARDLWGSVEAALVASVAYAFAPFALRELLLYGGNLPQYLAIGLFPWVLWAMTRAARTRSWTWVGLAGLFYAGIMLSHLFQVLVFTPVAGLYGLILLAEDAPGREQGLNLFRRLVGLSWPLLALPLGLLLSAFFWVPAFTERFFTRAQPQIYLDKSPFFVRYPQAAELVAWIQPLDSRAANPYVPLTLGVVTLVLAGLGLLAGLAALRRPALAAPASRLRPGYALFFALLAALAGWMTLPLSRPLWETVTILQVAEFPWRMLGLVNLGLAFLAGGALLLPPPRLRPPLAATCLLVQVLAVAPYLYPVIPFTRYDRLTLADQADYERRSQSIGTTTLGEYLPQAVERVPKTSPMLKALLAGVNPERLDRASLPAGATAALLEQNAVTHRYRLSSPAPFILRLFQFDYPGWRASLDGRPVALRPEAKTGLILIDVPAGEHTLTVHFGEIPGRVAALGLTGLTLVALLAAALLRRRTTGNRGQILSPPALRLTSPAVWLGAGIIVAGALWLTPLLRPVFTFASPPDQARPAQYRADVRFDNGIRLIGYDLNRAVVPAGGYLQVVLYWQTETAPIPANLQPFVHLDRLDNWTTVADATNYTPGDPTTESNVPTFHWDTQRYVRDEHDFILPAALAPQAYAVRVGLLDPDAQGRLVPLAGSQGDTAWLATVNVAPGAGRPASLAQPLAVTFRNTSDAIHLKGFELNSLTAGRLDFTLAWQADGKLQTDYTVFAQLLDAQGRLTAGFDRPPLDGAYPTSTWLPGQAILDPRFIPLADIPPGDYRLVVGLYDPATQQRLATAEGTDYVEVTRVTIGREP